MCKTDECASCSENCSRGISYAYSYRPVSIWQIIIAPIKLSRLQNAAKPTELEKSKIYYEKNLKRGKEIGSFI